MKSFRISSTPYILLLVSLLSIALAACKEPEVFVPTTPTSMNGTITVILDEFMGTPIVLAGSEGRNIALAFDARLSDGSHPDFKAASLPLPALLEDAEGNIWDMFGEAIEGPRQGEYLQSMQGYMGYWFSFGSFYPGAEIYDDNRTTNPPAPTPNPNLDWSLPIQNIYAGAGRDGIPSLETPAIDVFIERDYLEKSYYLSDEDLIVGIKVGDTYRAYSHAVLNWHEIVNDTIKGEAVSIIYCPLTGTAMAWSRVINGQETTFGVSGLLYNNNVMPYDRATGSIWSQMREDCVNGFHQGIEAERIPLIETSWGNWRRMFRESQILSDQTGVSRDYTEYPYGTYRENNDFLAFPLTFDDTRLPRKERVFGIVLNGEAKVYRLSSF